MKKKKYLPLYYKWMGNGELPRDGLCHCLDESKDDLELFKPLDFSGGYWGYWAEKYNHPVMSQDVDVSTKRKLQYEFTPLRQNIVLFLAAMNQEL